MQPSSTRFFSTTNGVPTMDCKLFECSGGGALSSLSSVALGGIARKPDPVHQTLRSGHLNFSTNGVPVPHDINVVPSEEWAADAATSLITNGMAVLRLREPILLPAETSHTTVSRLTRSLPSSRFCRAL